jgi:hypothetical protein
MGVVEFLGTVSGQVKVVTGLLGVVDVMLNPFCLVEPVHTSVPPNLIFLKSKPTVYQ